MAVAVDTIGVVSGILGIFSFLQDQLPSTEAPSNKFRLSVSNDGTESLMGPGNSGGTAPDVRIWSPTGESLGITVNDDTHCDQGNIVCDFQVNDVTQAPDYALFTANSDAICLTSLRTTYPDDSKFSVVIGNYAEICNTQYGIDGASWFYTPDYFQTESDGSINVRCAWLDADGDQPTTGIQVHWPDYDGNTQPWQSQDPGHFCNNAPTLLFRTDPQPNGVTFYTNTKRDPSAVATTNSLAPETAKQITKRSGSSHQFAHRLIKSALDNQTASYICTARGAAGPSFVSYQERQFCHMPTKTLFPFCEDTDTGACYDDELELVVPKLIGAKFARDLNIPVLNFTSVAKWTEPKLVR